MGKMNTEPREIPFKFLAMSGLCILWASLVAWGKESVCQCRKRRRCGLDPWMRKDPLDEEKATHSSVLARKILWGLARHSPWGCK